MNNFNIWKHAFMNSLISLDDEFVVPFKCEYFLEDNNGRIEFRHNNIVYYRTILKFIENMESFSYLTITAANNDYYMQCYMGRNSYKLVEIGEKLDDHETLVSQYHRYYGETNSNFTATEVFEIFASYTITGSEKIGNYAIARKIYGV